jgi:Cu2+-exporting ATPase
VTAAAPRMSAPENTLAAPRAGAGCAHCGLPVPGGEPNESEPQFCCRACGVAYAVIQDAGLGAYYRQREGAEAAPIGTQSTGRTYAEYDDPTFSERHVSAHEDGARLRLFLSGVHCGACVWLIERLPRVVPGVRSARLDLAHGAVDVVFQPKETSPGAIARALDGLGYAPHVSSAAQRDGELATERALIVRLGVAFALAGNVMLMALALYSGAAADPAYAALFRWGSLLLSVPAVFYSGGVFLRGAVAALRTRTPHMDLPVAIGILAGFTRSAWNTVAGRGEVYFDSIAVLIFLLLVGRFLQLRHHRGASRALESIAALSPPSAHLVEGEGLRDVPVEALFPSALVHVDRDERIPADGIVTQGHSSVDTSFLTGESLPEEIEPGSRVYAGTLNRASAVRLRVEATGAESRLGRLLEAVEKAQARRAPIVLYANRVARYFVLAVLALSAVTLGIWWHVDPSLAVDRAVALLVVTCPCALGMATPLAVSAALKRAAEASIFFKGGEFLEALARPATIAFDKTGTLTEGKLALVSFTGDESLKPLIRAAEAQSSHPIGRALAAAFCDAPVVEAESAREVAGAGVIARVMGHELRIGSAQFVFGDAPSERFRGELERQAALGRPAVAIAVDGEVRAVVGFSDPIRKDARHSLDRLRALGYEIAILSGDQALVVESVARELGRLVEARGAMSPEQKLAWVERARQRGPVVMVGDGVNDAAAMSAADVSIAVHGGAEASILSADAFTTLPGVVKIVDAVVGARRTLRVIRRGIGFSLAYNAVGVALCMAGFISPLVAAVLMPLSSLTVVSSALRARTFAPRRAWRLFP